MLICKNSMRVLLVVMLVFVVPAHAMRSFEGINGGRNGLDSDGENEDEKEIAECVITAELDSWSQRDAVEGVEAKKNNAFFAQLKSHFFVKNFVVSAQTKELFKQQIPCEIVTAVCHDLAPYYMERQHDRAEAMQFLLHQGANPNKEVKYMCKLPNPSLHSDNDNLLQAMLFLDTYISSQEEYGGLCFNVLEPVIYALVDAGLRVNHVNDNGFSVLDYAANIGTYAALRAQARGATVTKHYYKYFWLKEILLKALSKAQLRWDSIENTLLCTTTMSSATIKIVHEYSNTADRRDESLYVKDYYIQGEEPLSVVVMQSVGKVIREIRQDAKERCVIA